MDLARRLALAEYASRPLGDRDCVNSPTLSLVDRCLEVSESILHGGRIRCEEGIELSQIASVLKAATAGQAEDDKPASYALAVLHFVERTLGLTKPSPRRRKEPQRPGMVSFADDRRRARECGTYSTPDFIVDSMLRDLCSASAQRKTLDILDLSMEGGHFALGARLRVQKRQALRFFGMDQDHVAVELASRIVDFAGTRGRRVDFAFSCSCQDSLLTPLPRNWPRQYDAVVGNPPWIARKPIVSEVLRKRFWPLLRGHYDVYLAFMLRAHAVLKPGGYLTYVVPSGFLFNCTAAPIRRLLLEDYDILSLTTYPQRSFVEVPCVIPISFLARKKSSTSNDRTVLTRIKNEQTGLGGPDRPRVCMSARVADIWKRVPGFGMNPLVRAGTEFLVSGLRGVLLGELGKVSSGARLAQFHPKSSSTAFRAVHACDLRPFHACLRNVKLYMPRDAVFDRPPAREVIRAEKVVFQELRYMTHSQRLLAAVAGPGTLPVSTAALFLPRDSGTAPFFAALLNSALANAWYKLRDVNRAIKIGYLRQLPVPDNPKMWRSIAELAGECAWLRTFFHDRLNSCTLRAEEERLANQFPKQWNRLVRYQRTIDVQVLDLYQITKSQRPYVFRLAAARVF